MSARTQAAARCAILTALALAGGAPGLAPSPAVASQESPQPASIRDDAIVLEESLEIDITSKALARVRFRNRTQVLTARGADRYDSADVDFRQGIVVREFRGAVISPEGKRTEVKKQNVADMAAFADYELYSDTMLRVMSFPGVVPGSTLEYSYEQEFRNLAYLPSDVPMQDFVPVRLKTLTVRAPAAYPLRVSVRGRPEYAKSEEGGLVVQRWTVRDVPALRREETMPPLSDLVPRVSITPTEFVWGDHDVATADWNGVGRFYWDLARDRMEPAPEVSEMARSLTSGASTPEDKTRALFEFAQGKINYVAVELGVGGYQPHPNADILRHRYGDCKDKATLFIAMMRAAGFTAYPVLIRTRGSGLVDRDDPQLAFNHAIAALPQGEGYLFLDPTDTLTPFGDLPWGDQGVPVLVVKENGASQMTETPLFPPERNRRHRMVTATVSAAGDLEGSYVIEAWGQRKVSLAALLDARASDRADTLEDLVAAISPGAIMKSHEVKAPARPADPLRITLGFQVPRYVALAGAMKILSPQLARNGWLTEVAAYPNRLHPILFPQLMQDTSEVRLTLPAGMTLRKVPAARELAASGVASKTRYEMTSENDRTVLVVRREVTIGRREIPPSEYAQLRDVLNALGEEDAMAVTLTPGAPGG